nr:hypothetical protein [Rhizobium sullae]
MARTSLPDGIVEQIGFELRAVFDIGQAYGNGSICLAHHLAHHRDEQRLLA